MRQDMNGVRLQQLALKTKRKEGESSIGKVKEAILDAMRDRGFRVGSSLSVKPLYAAREGLKRARPCGSRPAASGGGRDIVSGS